MANEKTESEAVLSSLSIAHLCGEYGASRYELEVPSDGGIIDAVLVRPDGKRIAVEAKKGISYSLVGQAACAKSSGMYWRVVALITHETDTGRIRKTVPVQRAVRTMLEMGCHVWAIRSGVPHRVRRAEDIEPSGSPYQGARISDVSISILKIAKSLGEITSKDFAIPGIESNSKLHSLAKQGFITKCGEKVRGSRVSWALTRKGEEVIARYDIGH
jgi:hypothetical protein